MMKRNISGGPRSVAVVGGPRSVAAATFALAVALCISHGALAITATKEYVDRKDATNAAEIAALGVKVGEISATASNNTERLDGVDLRFETTPTLDDISAIADDIIDIVKKVATNKSEIASLSSNVYTKAETDAKIVELAPPTSLAPATNYTDSVIGRFAQTGTVHYANGADIASQANQLWDAFGIRKYDASQILDEIANATNDLAESSAATYMPQTNAYTKAETDARIVELSPPTSLAPATNYTDSVISNYPTRAEVEAGWWSEWAFSDVAQGVTDMAVEETTAGGDPVLRFAFKYQGYSQSQYGPLGDFDISEFTVTGGFDDVPAGTLFKASRHRVAAPIPTNHVTKAELEQAISEIPIPEIDTSDLATKQELQAVSNEAQVMYRLYSGSNVVDEVTNYNSAVHLPSRRLYQLSDSNTYFKVWDELSQHSNTLAEAKSDATEKVNYLGDFVALNYAPRAWSKTTSGLGAEAPSNTTWISTPTTVIAGGLEYSKVIHSGGAVWVLCGNGMTVSAEPTTNAYMRLKADDDTEIWAIEKTDSVTVGAFSGGITVSGNTITIPVNVVSREPPTAFYRAALNDAAGWISQDEGSFSYTWSGSTGAWVFTFTASPLPSSGFFRFTYLMPGSTLIRHSAPTEFAGGVLINGTVHQMSELFGAPDTPSGAVPIRSGGSIVWVSPTSRVDGVSITTDDGAYRVRGFAAAANGTSPIKRGGRIEWDEIAGTPPDGVSIVTNDNKLMIKDFAAAASNMVPTKIGGSVKWVSPSNWVDVASIDSTNGLLQIKGFAAAPNSSILRKDEFGNLVWGGVSVITNQILAGSGINITDNGGGAVTISYSQTLETNDMETCSLTVITAVRYDETSHKFQKKSRTLTFKGSCGDESEWTDVFEAVSHASEHGLEDND